MEVRTEDIYLKTGDKLGLFEDRNKLPGSHHSGYYKNEDFLLGLQFLLIHSTYIYTD